MKHDIKSLLPAVREIVLRAGEMILEGWKRDIEISHKGPVDLVTETDIAVEEFLKTELAKLDAGIGFVGEESSSGGLGEELGEGLGKAGGELLKPAFVVDPVDGTTNYAHRVPFVATSVGLWSGGEVVLGVINCPLLGECFWAGRGLGAFSAVVRDNKIFKEERLVVSGTANLKESLLATGFPYDMERGLSGVLNRLEKFLPATRGMRRCGAAAIDMAYVAAGRFEAYYEEGIKPWDVAAGWLLVEEAGGMVTSFSGGKYGLADPRIIASNGRIHGEIVKLLKQ